MRMCGALIILAILAVLPSFHGNTIAELKAKKAEIVRKHLKRLKKEEGGIKLVGGRGEFEGKWLSK